ncbi:MAG: RNA-binding transcriptional accessory protein [Clostridiales bacterium]|jgi:uncharacterized protein|nr:RNA-binding transcriptional accessory protein [Clostridiales bacterium]
MDIKQKLAQEFTLKLEHSSNIVDLIADGNTIPFIARYRKEMHGDCGDEVLRDFADRLNYLQNLQKRKEEVQSSIDGQGKWTDELAVALENAQTMTEVEDIYRPYKQKKKTRASVAIERGLQPLADIILAQELQQGDIAEIALPYVNPENQIDNVQDALNGAKDIIAEHISDDANCRKYLRDLYFSQGKIQATLLQVTDKTAEKALIYEGYKDFAQNIKDLPSHRILAINRGETDDCIKVDIEVDRVQCIAVLNKVFLKDSIFNELMKESIEDSYDRLISPSIERETRSDLTDKANEQAIKMFEVNLKPLLMQPPLKDKVILGLDPAYRTGCKIAVIDKSGNLVDSAVIYPTPPQNKTKEAMEVLTKLIYKHSVDVISIGNGTASKESEIFVVELIKTLDRPVNYIVVNEAGASVYSASKLGSEEFPNYDVAIRSAASIARRLLDPLAELIKIDVKSIGVGQYQHDMPQKRLTEVLEGVVEDCVNSVGVELNTASYSLLAYVAGLNTTIAKNIIKHRQNEPFTSREQLLKVPKLGPKAYQQCAGFLRIQDSCNVLDKTAVHPESYKAASSLLQILGYDSASNSGLTDIKQNLEQYGVDKAANQCEVGIPTLLDIIDELAKPGRDVRDSLPSPVLRADLMDLKDLQIDMELTGVVRNVIDFGAFVDIGVHQDGLVHLSQCADRYVRHPSEVLKVGDTVKVRVLEVDTVKKRIALTMRTKGLEKPAPKTAQQKETDRQERMKKFDSNKNFKKQHNQNQQPVANNATQSVEDMLILLQNKYKK